MNRERLLRLADYMEGVAPENYNQGDWVNGSSLGMTQAPDEFDPARIVVREGACGTTMCVFGHAVAAVPEAGLWFSGRHFPYWVVVRFRDPETGVIHSGFAAARHAFDLPENHASVLFGGTDGPSTYIFYTGQAYDYDKGRIEESRSFHASVTPKTVAEALRRYVETDGETAEMAMKLAECCDE
jgi:hypothetical protein